MKQNIYIMLVGISIILSIIGVTIAMVGGGSGHSYKEIVKCYDYSNNEIIGMGCIEEKNIYPPLSIFGIQLMLIGLIGVMVFVIILVEGLPYS